MVRRFLRHLPLLLLVPTVPCLALGPSTAGAEVLQAFSEGVEALSRRVAPSVVQVVATVSARAYSPETSAVSDFKERYAGIGSGVVLAPQGYILTNSHVLEGARRVEVILHPEAVRAAGLDGPLLPARIVGFSTDHDLALLRVEASNLPYLEFRPDGLPRQGEVVFAFGSPQGFSDSVSLGVVSAPSRLLAGERGQPYIQTDAPIHPGNSGGPLVDTEGRIVGINTLLYSESGGDEGIGFAIPAFTARFVAAELKARGRVRPLGLGLSVRPLTPVLAASLHLPGGEGLLIEDVLPGGPAEQAGLRPGELLTSLEGRPLRDLADFLRILENEPPPATVKGEVTDGRSRRTFTAAPTEWGERPPEALLSPAVSRALLPGLGVEGMTLDPKDPLAEGKRSPNGVVVLKRLYPPLPDEATLLPGDVIHAVGRAPVKNLEALERLLEEKRSGTPLVLQVEREGSLFYLVSETE